MQIGSDDICVGDFVGGFGKRRCRHIHVTVTKNIILQEMCLKKYGSQ